MDFRDTMAHWPKVPMRIILGEGPEIKPQSPNLESSQKSTLAGRQDIGRLGGRGARGPHTRDGAAPNREPDKLNVEQGRQQAEIEWGGHGSNP